MGDYGESGSGFGWGPQHDQPGGWDRSGYGRTDPYGQHHGQPGFDPAAGYGQQPGRPEFGPPFDDGRQATAPRGYAQPPGPGLPSYRDPSGRGPDGRRGKKLGFILGGVSLAFVLMVVVGVVAVVKIESESETASDVVEGYLQALSEGNAEQALNHMTEKPSDTSLMTRKVLKKSNKIAPITDINVHERTSDASRVNAAYRVGGQMTVARFRTKKTDGDYLLDGAYTKITLRSVSQGSNLPVTVNGAEVKNSKGTIYVFPGGYELDTPSKYVDLGSGSEFTVTNPETSRPSVFLRPELNAKGQRLFKQKIEKAARACLASKKLKAGCGLDLPKTTRSGSKLREGTVSRDPDSSTSARIKNIQARVDHKDPSVATSQLYLGNVETEVRGTRSDGRTGKIRIIGTRFGKPSVDLVDPHAKVLWD